MHLGGDYRVFAGALLVGIVRHENSHEFFTATPKSEPLLGSRKTRARAVSLRRAHSPKGGWISPSSANKTPPRSETGRPRGESTPMGSGASRMSRGKRGVSVSV